MIMDLVNSCKDKLANFRIKELKDVLSQLGLSKQGRKQDLVERIVSVLSDEQVFGNWTKRKGVTKEEVVKLVDDTYRKMQVSETTDLASKVPCVSDSIDVKLIDEVENPHRLIKIRCPCESSLRTDSMVKCEDLRCHVWQHTGCVVVPEKPLEDVQAVLPQLFYCELCRLSRADPFWVTVAHPLYPVKLAFTNLPVDGDHVQSVNRTFNLTRADKDLLLKQHYGIQAWCMLFNDKVPFRMQWPKHAELHVNGVLVRVMNRPGSQLLGFNGRDDGPVITQYTGDGVNKISLTGCDTRVFCLGVRIVRRRTVQQILNLIPKESDGEQFEDALARVRRCVGGSTSSKSADSDNDDSDLEVIADCIPVNLRCPMSGLRIKVAGRFKPCAHMGCFDLEVLVEMNQHSRKWQCPICLKNYTLEDLIIDPYFNHITSKIRNCDDVTEIVVKPDGSWRAKTEGNCGSLGVLGYWHLPDGSFSVPNDEEANLKSKVSQQIRQECTSDGCSNLRLGMKTNHSGFFEASKEDMQTRLSNDISCKFEYHAEDIICMSSSSTSCGRDGEDPSTDRKASGLFNSATSTGIELFCSSIPNNPRHRLTGHIPLANEVILLSDSDEDNENLNSSGTSYKNYQTDATGLAFSSPLRVPDSFSKDVILGTHGGSSPGVFTSDNEFLPIWPISPVNQGNPCSDLLDGLDDLVNMQHSSISCSTSVRECALITGCAIGSTTAVSTSCTDRPDTDLAAFDLDDSSHQTVPQVRYSGASVQTHTKDQSNTPNDICTLNCVSLQCDGDDGNWICGKPASANRSKLGHLLPLEGALDSPTNTNENRYVKVSRGLQDSLSSFPRQQRSVRPRCT